MDYAQAIKDRLAKDPKASVADLQKARADKIAGKGQEGQDYFKSYNEAQRASHVTGISSTNSAKISKPVEISGSGGVRTLNKIEDATSDAERSIFLGQQDVIRNKSLNPDGTRKQYAYVDEYGFEHVAGLESAIAYGGERGYQEYNGLSSGGYARDAQGRRAMMGLDGSRNYGNAPVDNLGNPLRYDAYGNVVGNRYNLNSMLDEYQPQIQAQVAPVIQPVVAPAPPVVRTNNPPPKKAVVPLSPNYPGGSKYGDDPYVPTEQVAHPTNPMKIAPIGGGMEPKSGGYGDAPTLNNFTLEELKSVARGTGTAALMAQQKLRQMGMNW